MSEIIIRAKGYLKKILQPINEVPGYLRVRSRGRYHIRTSETKKEISPRSENNFLFYRHFKSTRPILKVCEKSQKSVAIQIFDPITFFIDQPVLVKNAIFHSTVFTVLFSTITRIFVRFFYKTYPRKMSIDGFQTLFRKVQNFQILTYRR